MTKVFGYSRSNRGIDGIKFQNQQIVNYAKKNILKIERIYSDIGSGAHVGNQLQKLIYDMPNGSTLLITDRTRLSRVTTDYDLIRNELLSKEVSIIFTNNS